MFRTWIIRQCNPVWVHKLADIVTSLWLGNIVLPKELFQCAIFTWKHFAKLIRSRLWNKWVYESVKHIADFYFNALTGILPSKEFYQGYIGTQYGTNPPNLLHFQTFIGEQEQLKKLSDNFGLLKQNKLYLVRDCWLWLKRFKVQRKLSVKYKCVVCVFV